MLHELNNKNNYNDVRVLGKHASMVQTQLEELAKSQRELLDEMNNNISDFAVR